MNDSRLGQGKVATDDFSGPGGRIVKADIDAAMSQPHPPTAPAAADYAVVPLSAMRKVIAERMTHSKPTAPHFYLTVDCEIDEMLQRVARDIRNMYTIGYVPSQQATAARNARRALRRVAVDVRLPTGQRVDVRTRRAYLAGDEDPAKR